MTDFVSSSRSHVPAASPAQGESAGFRYYDGNSAQPYPVDIQSEARHLRILSPSGATMAIWARESIVLPDFMNPPYCLTHLQGGGDSGERLTVANKAAHARLEPFLRDIRKTARRSSLRRLLRAGAAIWVLGLLLWWVFPYATEAVVNMVPLEVERRLGEDVRDQVGVLLARKQDGNVSECDKAEGVGMLDALVGRLAAAEDSPYAFSVRVVDSGIVNAFAAPGGAILVTSGLIEKAESPEELAGVLAHEMGHVKERHGLRSMAGAYGLQLLAVLFSGNSSNMTGDTARGLAMYMTTSSWSREFERDADAHAFALLRKAGMSADGLIAFFQRLDKEAKEDDSFLPSLELLSSHPATEERIAMLQAMQREAGQNTDLNAGQRGELMSWARWQYIRNICD
ncbi:M48 family metallopeptidase [Desulfovibrio mangrovi]|uniref:M48 family metallopeptidase n=1 Tax=Desulfovibrio mangrovi TaxID=2976983 RepID=UPI0022475ECA|nr:M48 family metallopeptidase [Desulfovibrio mangrovi]UZP66416.1 M48 family metallopeptidase [Desulfovibrio mangrovi]